MLDSRIVCTTNDSNAVIMILIKEKGDLCTSIARSLPLRDGETKEV